jgi:type IV secretory pathway TrbD component
MLINFPFALAAWVLLFCGVVLGTTLLITLPFGVVFWFLTLFLSRSFARAEVGLK